MSTISRFRFKQVKNAQFLIAPPQKRCSRAATKTGEDLRRGGSNHGVTMRRPWAFWREWVVYQVHICNRGRVFQRFSSGPGGWVAGTKGKGRREVRMYSR